MISVTALIQPFRSIENQDAARCALKLKSKNALSRSTINGDDAISRPRLVQALWNTPYDELADLQREKKRAL